MTSPTSSPSSPSSSPPSPPQPQPSPLSTIIRLFALWKGSLLLVAIGSSLVSPAYDTSAGLLLSSASASANSTTHSSPSILTLILARLSSWDAIYFTQQSVRGYVYEQEWAFGAALPLVTRGLLKALNPLGCPSGPTAAALVGVVVAHVSHLASALALFRLSSLVLADRRRALVAACLHVLSPAGLFLSAPYAEALFSLLTFSGFLLFGWGQQQTVGIEEEPGSSLLAADLRQGCLLQLSGLLLGLATSARTNGLLNALPFVHALLRDLLRLGERPSVGNVVRVAAAGLGGLAVAMGSFIPQAVAWMRYCSAGLDESLVRPGWCGKAMPSIYSHVQQHYWGTGLFRYWTLPNAPLFLLASPMLYIMIRSGWEVTTAPSSIATITAKTSSTASSRGAMVDLIRSMAAAQLLLSLLALTSYHVQIITRLSSGYPVWYWWLARRLAGDDEKDAVFGRRFVAFMLMYGSIQAVLFSSFLPPA